MTPPSPLPPASTPRPERRRSNAIAYPDDIDELARLVGIVNEQGEASLTAASLAAASLAAAVPAAPPTRGRVPLAPLDPNDKGLRLEEVGPAPALSCRSGPSPTTVAARGRRRRSSLSTMVRVVPPTTTGRRSLSGGVRPRTSIGSDIDDLTASEPEPEPETKPEVEVEVDTIDLTGEEASEFTDAAATIPRPGKVEERESG